MTPSGKSGELFMLALDTNVLIRFLVEDDAGCEAVATFDLTLAGEPGFIAPGS